MHIYIKDSIGLENEVEILSYITGYIKHSVWFKHYAG